jgi:hypothetical protein
VHQTHTIDLSCSSLFLPHSLNSLFASWKLKDSDAKFFAQWKAIAHLGYYPFDHLYFLASKKLIDVDEPRKFLRWSCQSWMVYILLDIALDFHNVRNHFRRRRQLLREQQRQQEKSSGGATTSTTTTAAGDRIEPVPSSLPLPELNWTDLSIKAVRNGSDLVLAINWSVKQEFLSPTTVGTLGFVGSVAGTMLMWRGTK